MARRVLCFPLHRHWLLFMRAADDVKAILRGGRRLVLKCLLVREMHSEREGKSLWWWWPVVVEVVMVAVIIARMVYTVM